MKKHKLGILLIGLLLTTAVGYASDGPTNQKPAWEKATVQPITHCVVNDGIEYNLFAQAETPASHETSLEQPQTATDSNFVEPNLTTPLAAPEPDNPPGEKVLNDIIKGTGLDVDTSLSVEEGTKKAQEAITALKNRQWWLGGSLLLSLIVSIVITVVKKNKYSKGG